MFNRLALVITLSLLVAACASSGSSSGAPRVDPLQMPVAEFMAEQQRLRANLEQGEPRELNQAEWDQVNRIHAGFDQILGDVRTVRELSDEDIQRLIRLRGELVAVLAADRPDEIVCLRVRHTTGTRLAGQQRCVTRAQLERERFEADFLMRYIKALPQGFEGEEGRGL